MDVIGYDPYLSVDAALKLSRHVKKVNDLNEICTNSDYITIHVPYMESTKDTINAENIALMKDGVKILNFARNGLVNNDAIKAALASGKVSSYVVDFPNEETVNQKGIIAIPHLGASTAESEDNCAIMAANELADYLENGNIQNSVNLPNCSLPSSGVGRVTIIHKNIKNMLGKFTEILSDVNISDMINKSKNDIAYTIINTDHKVDDAVIKKLEAIDDVIAVRVIA